jgi:hypothetical protein
MGMFKNERVVVGLILCAHVVLGWLYAMNVPWWESYDAPIHYRYARFLALNRAIPREPVSRLVPFIPNQPPLYYGLVATVISPLDLSADIEPELNPGGAWRRIYLYDPALNDIRTSPVGLSVFMGRMVSLLLGTVAVACTYLAARNFFPNRPFVRLAATLLHAFWPLSTFVGSIISNDVAVACGGSLTLWAVSRFYRQSLSPTIKQTIINSAIVGFAFIFTIFSKANGYALLPFLATLILPAAGQLMRRRPMLAMGFILLGVAGAVASVFIIPETIVNRIKQDQSLFEDTLGSVGGSPIVAIFRLTGAKLLQPTLLRYVPDFMFGIFGSGSLYMPITWYQIARVSYLLPIVGLFFAPRKGFRASRLVMLASMLFWFMLVAILPTVLKNELWQSFQARYFLPAYSAVMILFAVGIYALPARVAKIAQAYVLGGVVLVGIMIPWVVMQLNYARKPSFVADRFTYSYTAQKNIALRFGESIELFGVTVPKDKLEIEAERLTFADDAEGFMARMNNVPVIELDWRALRKPADNYTLRIEAIVGQNAPQVVYNGIPGYQKFPTTHWTTGDQFRERVILPNRDVTAINISWYDPVNEALPTNCPQSTYCVVNLTK